MKFLYNDKNFSDIPECLEVVTLGTTQAKYAFDYSVIPVRGYNMAIYMNFLMHNIVILKNNWKQIAERAVILITLQYPIFLCPNSGDLSFQEETKVRIENRYIYAKNEEYLKQLNRRNRKINHMKLWEVDQELYELIHSGWEHEIGISGIVLNNAGEDIAKRKCKYGMRDLEHLICLCREHLWNPVMIGLPYSKELNDYVPWDFKEKNFYDCIDMVKNKTGCRFYDYSMDSRFEDLNYYINVWFLNDRGREKFTRIIYEEIIRKEMKR